MRELSMCEISYVGGGPSDGAAESPISTAVGNACVGMPDSANVTATIGTPGLTLGGLGFSSSTSISATVNCGDYNAANSSSSSSSSGPSSGSSSGIYTPYVMGSGPYIAYTPGNFGV